jgi:hypothetical protein
MQRPLGAKSNRQQQRTVKNQQGAYVLGKTYWYEVCNGKKLNAWQLLKCLKYPAASSNFERQEFLTRELSEDDWIVLPRTTRHRYKMFVSNKLAGLSVKERAEICARCEEESATLGGAAVNSEDEVQEEGESQLDDREPSSFGITGQDEDLQRGESLFQFVSDDDEDDGQGEFIFDLDHRGEDDDYRDEASSTLNDGSVSRPPPDPCLDQDICDRMSVLGLDESGEVVVNPLLAPRKRPLLASELFDSYIIDNNMPLDSADRFIKDLRREDVVWDLDRIPLNIRNRCKVPSLSTKKDQEGALNNVTESINGRYHHFGLYDELKKHLQRVLDATFPDGKARPSVPSVCIDAWTDGAKVTETGAIVHIYPVCIR